MNDAVQQGLLAALGQPLTVLDVRHRMHNIATTSTSSSDTQHSDQQQQQVDAAQLAHAFFAAVSNFSYWNYIYI
jgi:hypothetical protein